MSFQQGLSGLNASSKSLDVIGNNIANANTYGAKSSRAEFADVYAAALNGAGTNNVGIGVKIGAVAQQFTQGNISITENPMDLAINGAGFFQVEDKDGSPFYTRNGQFKIDKDGYIVNNESLKLKGFPADNLGNPIQGTPSALKLPTGGIDPNVTGNLSLEFTLDSRSKATASYELTDPNDPNSDKIDLEGITLNDPKTYNNATSMTVYDAMGQPVAVTMYFQRANNLDSDGNTVWNVYVTANGSAVRYNANGDPIDTDDNTATGNPLTPYTKITFGPTGGKPVSPGASELLNLKIPAGVNSQGAPTLSIPAPPADLSDPAVQGISLDLRSATENGSSFSVSSLSQDGFAPGKLIGVSVENDGTVTARYSNGETKGAGQIVLANFRNPQGLQPMGGNLWQATNAAGDPNTDPPGAGSMGTLQAGSLEESNVDLTAELVNMVTAQRAYQANAQTIKTQDQVLQTLVNLR